MIAGQDGNTELETLVLQGGQAKRRDLGKLPLCRYGRELQRIGPGDHIGGQQRHLRQIMAAGQLFLQGMDLEVGALDLHPMLLFKLIAELMQIAAGVTAKIKIETQCAHHDTSQWEARDLLCQRPECQRAAISRARQSSSTASASQIPSMPKPREKANR